MTFAPIEASAALLSWIGCALLLLLGRRLELGLDETDGHQKLHTSPTPRVGGMSIALSWAAVGLLAGPASPLHKMLLLAALPLLAIGVIEDLRRHLPVRLRALVGLVASALVVMLGGLAINRVGMPWINAALQAWPILAALLAVIAIGSMPHAFNMIDGLNGLAAGVSAMTLGAIAHVALTCGDADIARVALTLMAAVLGFAVWNWPWGKLFMGDTGAYLLGFVCAGLAVALVQRHAEVSAWFALLVLLYPSWELVFSLLRRAWLHRTPGMGADARHLHHLTLGAVQRALGTAATPGLSNALSALPMLALHALALVPAALLWRQADAPLQLAWTLGFMLLYTGLYFMLRRAAARKP